MHARLCRPTRAGEQALRVPEGARAGLDPRLCHDGVHWFLLPSFFHTLHALHIVTRYDYS